MSETWQSQLDRLFRELFARLSAYVRANTWNPADADDLLQEAYKQMLSIPEFVTIHNPEAYLFAIVRNLIRSHRARERRRLDVDDIEDPGVEVQLAELPDFGWLIDMEKHAAKLRAVLSGFPARWQAAVIMVHWEGMSYAQAAAKLGVSVNSVKKYLKRAMEQFRLHMAEHR